MRTPRAERASENMSPLKGGWGSLARRAEHKSSDITGSGLTKNGAIFVATTASLPAIFKQGYHKEENYSAAGKYLVTPPLKSISCEGVSI